MATVDLTAQRAHDLFDYNPTTGVLVRKFWRGGRGGAGTTVGVKTALGYLQIRVDGRHYLVHRVAWLMTHGNWPAEQIDHIDRVRDNNKLSNLREATNAENLRNKGQYRTNKSGATGVHFNRQRKKWEAAFVIDGARKYVGLYRSVEEASEARAEAQRGHAASRLLTASD